MSQLNIHMTADFQQELEKFMRKRHIKTKSDAIRIAIKEGLERSCTPFKVINFSAWLGLAMKVPLNKKYIFHSNNDLWGS